MKKGIIRQRGNRKTVKRKSEIFWRKQYNNYSRFDRKRRAHLLKVMNWCSDIFANFVDDMRRVNKSFGELIYLFIYLPLNDQRLDESISGFCENDMFSQVVNSFIRKTSNNHRGFESQKLISLFLLVG